MNKIFRIFFILVFLYSSFPAFAAEKISNENFEKIETEEVPSPIIREIKAPQIIGEKQAFSNEQTKIQIFVRDDCAHCKAEKDFFLEKNIDVETINIRSSEHNNALFQQFTTLFELSRVTPITLAGDQIFVGFKDGKTTGTAILKAFEESEKKYSFSSALENISNITISGKAEVCDDAGEECTVSGTSFLSEVEIPFYGVVNLQDAGRYTVSFILGLLDGFNPCAMWVLVIFIITLIQIGDRVKMAFVAGTFLLAEGIMYGLILVSWWKFFDFVGYDSIVKPIVGIVALGGGLFFLYEGVFTDGTCKVTNAEQRKKISDKISEIAHSPISIATFFGILLLAFSVNIIEFACSLGYPQIFTTLLNEETIVMSEKVGMLLTYLGAYMLDDILVFGIALYSIEKLGVTHKYAKYSNIFGGILMLILGMLMIFAPKYLAL